MRPNPLIARAYLTRGLYLWLGARLLASASMTLGGGNPLDLSFIQAMWMIGISTALGLADVRWRRERALTENLGVTRTMLVALFAIPALIGELLIGLAEVARR